MKLASKGGSICEHTFEWPRIKIDQIEFIEVEENDNSRTTQVEEAGSEKTKP